MLMKLPGITVEVLSPVELIDPEFVSPIAKICGFVVAVDVL